MCWSQWAHLSTRRDLHSCWWMQYMVRGWAMLKLGNFHVLSLSLSTCTSTGASLCTLMACPQSCVDENGNRYSVGQSFPAADGCNNWWVNLLQWYHQKSNNVWYYSDTLMTHYMIVLIWVHRRLQSFFYIISSTCTSSGAISCTRRACPDICSLPAQVGPCDALFYRYHYNTSTRICERFVYGGCQGNQNNFQTAGDCYRRCNPSSTLRKMCMHGIASAILYPTVYMEISAEDMVTFTIIIIKYSTEINVLKKQRYM